MIWLAYLAAYIAFVAFMYGMMALNDE